MFADCYVIKNLQNLRHWEGLLIQIVLFQVSLKKDHQERIWEDIQELKNMLAVGFGQWNELMTYPFPFKFLQEYLDNQSETTFSKHWSEM